MVGVLIDYECELCKSPMEIVETKRIGNTPYHMLKCRKCNRTVAKRAENG